VNTYLDIVGTAARVLIVDDDRANRALLQLFLRPDGYLLSTASSGEHALAMIAEHHPDLVLVDIMMPGMDGYEFTERLKNDPATTSIPVIMITALDDRHARMAGLTAGAEEFLSKPVDRAELCVRVRNLLRLKAFTDMHDRQSQKLERDVIARTVELRKQADRAQRYLDTAQVILLALDTNGNISLVNRYACAVLGWSAEELIGRSWIDTCVAPRMRAHVRTRFATLLAGSTSVSENVVVTRSGEERLMEWRSTLVRDDAGVVSGTFSSGTDITERHQAVHALQTSEYRTHFALKNASVGTWEMDYDAGIVRWSHILEEQHGLAPGTFPGTFAAFIECIHPDDRDTVRETMGKAAHSGDDFSLEYRAICADGTERWLCGTGRFHLGDGFERVHGVGISQDITARRQLEAQYRQAQKMDAIGQLASGVAHDFNNLLAVILGFAELMSLDVADSDQHGVELSEIIKAATRAAALTKHLLAFSRQQVLNPAPLDVNSLITEMTGMLGMLTGNGIRVVLDLAPFISPAIADRGQLEQVVMNLVVNARDAMPAGGTLTIETTDVDLESAAINDETIVKGQYVMIAITDTGHGMSKEIQRRLFEPFFTTKAQGKGTGLGLSTAYGIVKQSKGYLWVESEPDRGTTFKVYLPRSRRLVGQDRPTLNAPAPAPFASETVLLVEDEESVRRLAKRILGAAGYRVLEASNGDEAERSFAEHSDSIDLVLTDMLMPGCTGVELLNRLWARVPTLKAVYMSGNGARPDLTGKGAPRDLPFVQKPFTAAELQEKVRFALDRR
jgi:two-component system cell cycle sensor histidine kinase/response regulator CckA